MLNITKTFLRAIPIFADNIQQGGDFSRLKSVGKRNRTNDRNLRIKFISEDEESRI